MMMNFSKFAGAVTAFVVLLLIAIVMSTNAITLRLEQIAGTLNAEVLRKEGARDRETLVERVDEIETQLAESAEQWDTFSSEWETVTERLDRVEKQLTDLAGQWDAFAKEESAARKELAAKLERAVANTTQVISLELHMNFASPGIYHAEVIVADPPITSGIGEVLDREYAIKLDERDPKNVSKQFQYIVTKNKLDNGNVTINYVVTKAGGDEDASIKTLTFPYNELLKKGRAEVTLPNEVTLIVICHLGPLEIQTF